SSTRRTAILSGTVFGEQVTTSTYEDLQTIAQDPSRPIESLDPGESQPFMAVVSFPSEGDFELGVSGVGTNVFLQPKTHPVTISIAASGDEEAQQMSSVALSAAVGLAVAAVVVIALRIRRRWKVLATVRSRRSETNIP
ncbi:MAG: hypothetical protein WD472_06825, partial [Dehalococcoidia bacterium]